MATSPPQKDASTNHIVDVSATYSDKSTDKSNAASVDTGAANCVPTIDNVGSLLLAQQLSALKDSLRYILAQNSYIFNHQYRYQNKI